MLNCICALAWPADPFKGEDCPINGQFPCSSLETGALSEHSPATGPLLMITDFKWRQQLQVGPSQSWLGQR